MSTIATTHQCSSCGAHGVLPLVMTPQECADYIRVTERTLTNWRDRGHGPRFKKTGPGKTAQIRYLLSDVDAWLADDQSGTDVA